MGSYALINKGKVINKIAWDGETVLDFGDGVTAVEMPPNQLVNIGYDYKDGVFIAPPLTNDEMEEKKDLAKGNNIAMKSALMSEAGQKISIFQDAVDLDMATEQEVQSLKDWKKYRVLLNRIDPNTDEYIKWPAIPA